MKFKNYKSAIHNFAHSFQSIDYTHSGKLAVNVLIELKNKKLPTFVRFDFLNKLIDPPMAISDTSIELMNDYIKVFLPLY